METAEVVTEEVAAKVECLIHVSFNPDGTVALIGERPEGVKPQAWFKHLSQNTLNRYQALAGGRGMFKIPRAEVAALQASCTAGQTS